MVAFWKIASCCSGIGCLQTSAYAEEFKVRSMWGTQVDTGERTSQSGWDQSEDLREAILVDLVNRTLDARLEDIWQHS